MSEPIISLGEGTIDIDRLAERIEKAAGVVQQLRAERDRLTREAEENAARFRQLEQKLQGQDVGALMQELSALRKEQREWLSERRDVASKIETLVRKLERIES
jgi:chromosome segregation ATPase